MTDRITVDDGPSWVRLTFETPVLELATMEDIVERLDRLAQRIPQKPLILASAHPSIFLAGAHLAEIASLDEMSSVGYSASGRAVMARLDRFPSATIAAVAGSCSGGGFDLVLSCDRIVAGPSATFSHPGVRRGLVTGWGGTTRLPAAVGWPAARRIFLKAPVLGAQEAEDMGLATLSTGDVIADASRLSARLSGLHRARLATWRQLRNRSRERGWSPHCDTGYNY